MLLEIAAASDEKTLVTGNVRHYPVSGPGPVRVLAPADAVPLLIG